jgi:hypothetical protein
LVYNAADNLGSSYRGGGMSKAGFDCSGLVYTTFKTLKSPCQDLLTIWPIMALKSRQSKQRLVI